MKSQADVLQLEFRWTTSKGESTFGWNICTLWVNGEKVSSTCGGNYDSKGVAFAKYVAQSFPGRLRDLARPLIDEAENSPLGRFYTTGEYIALPGRDSFNTNAHGLSVWRNNTGEPINVSLEGAAGFEAMTRIAYAIGLDVRWVYGTPKKDVYLLTNADLDRRGHDDVLYCK
jgi:hypothetical protein